MPTEKTIQILLGILAGIALSLASFALYWVFNANSTIKVMTGIAALWLSRLQLSKATWIMAILVGRVKATKKNFIKPLTLVGGVV